MQRSEPLASTSTVRAIHAEGGPHRTWLLGDMGAFLERFFADVEHARRRVLIECFIVRDDVLGRRLGDALARAAARGVQVRLLYDPMGSRKTRAAFFAGLRARGVDTRFYGREAGPLARFWPRARNHSRIYVVDDVAYTGGHAWGDEGTGERPGRARVAGPLLPRRGPGGGGLRGPLRSALHRSRRQRRHVRRRHARALP